MMDERILHLIWDQMIIGATDLQSSCGKSIRIVKQGIYNRNSGPDFMQAKIVIDDQLWVGSVEIHDKSSYWNRHKHHLDKAYNAVILHVVYEEDSPVYNQLGQKVPCLVLKDWINLKAGKTNLDLLEPVSKIICRNQLEPRLLSEDYLSFLVKERFTSKTKQLHSLLVQTKNDWEQIMLYLLFIASGAPYYSFSFQLLFQRIPLSLIKKIKNNPIQLYLLIVSAAGLSDQLRETEKEKASDLFILYQHCYGLESMDKNQWAASKSRFSSQPLSRLHALSVILPHYRDLIPLILENSEIQTIKKYYQTEIKSAVKNYTLPWEHVLVNAIIPFLYLRGEIYSDAAIPQKAQNWLISTKAESNHIVQLWKNLGIPISNAFEAQGYYHLYQQYCLNFSCQNCEYGKNIIYFS